MKASALFLITFCIVNLVNSHRLLIHKFSIDVPEEKITLLGKLQYYGRMIPLPSVSSMTDFEEKRITVPKNIREKLHLRFLIQV